MKKLYITALILVLVSICLLISGMILHATTGSEATVELIILTVLSSFFALSGIILSCVYMKDRKESTD